MHQIETSIIQIISPEQAWHYKVVPYSIEQNVLQVYSEPDSSESNINELSFIIGKRISTNQISKNELSEMLHVYYRVEHQDRFSSNKNLRTNDEADMLLQIIQEARSLGSSDIHIESYEYNSRIRYRIDGELIDRFSIAREEYPSLINKIKIKAHLDISEKRLPQDGRILLQNGSDKTDIRVSILPALFGEKCVLRLLNNDVSQIDLRKVGMSEEQVQCYENAISKPFGIILISGPTGSGKTTTLYSTLKLLNKSSRNIVTIEDPVEYTIEGINQVALKESIGLTFPRALRSFLRQDPDIIMVGEIRDKETADMAIRASLTGHLVFSTIHTNSALGTINRLIDMDIPSFLIADTLLLSIAQRLVRLLCPSCKKEVSTPDSLQKYITSKTIFEAGSCDKCYHTGYKGRTAIYEMLPIQNEFKKAIRGKTHDSQSLKYVTLRESALNLIEQGITSLQEVSALVSL